tara:strand:- start:336 stop:521 length:186 start_codon:yes stop_codon:yes gene_type:complete
MVNKKKPEKKLLLEIVREVEELLVQEKLSAREILMVVREIENNATIALVLAQLAKFNLKKQ